MKPHQLPDIGKWERRRLRRRKFRLLEKQNKKELIVSIPSK